jgi:hypothetical protein
MSDFKSGFDDLGLPMTMDEIAIIFKDRGVSKSGCIRTQDILGRIVFDEAPIAEMQKEAEQVVEAA